MGASGTWHLGLKHPDFFAALGPYCGYVDTHRFSETPGEIRWAGRAHGADTAEVLGLCDTIATFYRGRLTSIRPHRDWSDQDLTREVMHTEAELL